LSFLPIKFLYCPLSHLWERARERVINFLTPLPNPLPFKKGERG